MYRSIDNILIDSGLETILKSVMVFHEKDAREGVFDRKDQKVSEPI